MVLKNGYISSGKTSIQTYNTCSFDCFFTVVAALYADFAEVRECIQQIETNCKFSQMVSSMFNNTQTVAIKQNSLLRQRNQILQIFLKIHRRVFQILEMD